MRLIPFWRTGVRGKSILRVQIFQSGADTPAFFRVRVFDERVFALFFAEQAVQQVFCGPIWYTGFLVCGLSVCGVFWCAGFWCVVFVAGMRVFSFSGIAWFVGVRAISMCRFFNDIYTLYLIIAS
jgi:hypothetical protein